MKQMTENEAEEFIVHILREADHKLLTRDIEEKTKEANEQCPDSAVRFLNKLRFKNIIKGELSIEKKGWVWWIEE